MTLMELQSIKKHFHSRPALNGIDLVIREGESITIFGPNGAGKTTLVKILSGIMAPGEGKVSFDGNSSGADMKRNIFYLGHKNSLYNSLTISENMDFLNRLFSRSNGTQRIETVLREHGLWEQRNDPVKELSQGLKRRVAIARGFITDAKIFIMDEPFTGLDLQWRWSVLEKIRQLKESGTSLVLATHLVEEGYDLADRIVFLNKGRIVFMKEKRETDIQEILSVFKSTEGGTA